jgi:predicted nuclease of predicted toxin-antitoxin system
VNPPVKFLIDECANPVIAEQLRERGIEAVACRDVCRRTFTDESHIRYAIQEARVIFSHDPDYLAWHRDGKPHGGIIWCHETSHTIGEILEFLELVTVCITADEMQNRLEIF